MIQLTATLWLLLVHPASSMCMGYGACYLPYIHTIVMDSETKLEYAPYVFAYEYGHSIGLADYSKEDYDFASQFGPVPPDMNDVTN